MFVRIIKPTIANGTPVDVDDVVNVTPRDARELFDLKKAVPHNADVETTKASHRGKETTTKKGSRRKRK